jgi:hypothetical protein
MNSLLRSELTNNMKANPSWDDSRSDVKKFHAFYVTRRFISASRQPTTGDYPDTVESLVGLVGLTAVNMKRSLLGCNAV